MTTQDLINTLRQGCAITPRLSREVVARLSEQDRVISEIRAVTALPDVPVVDLSGQIESLLSELADRQIRADIEPDEFRVAEYVEAEAKTRLVARALSLPYQAPWPLGDPEDDEW